MAIKFSQNKEIVKEERIEGEKKLVLLSFGDKQIGEA